MPFPPSPQMARALALAREAAAKEEVPVGAVLTAPDGSTLAEAHNLTRTLPDPTAHAEILAIRDAAGAEVARGLANYSSAEARLLCRKPSSEINALLGYMAESEMVHRDNMVLSRQ